MTSILVSVDGRSIDPVRFEFLFQDDPFPGGHTYELAVSPATELAQSIASTDGLARRETVQLFAAIDRLKAKEGLTPYSLDWYFNSVESIVEDNKGLVIRGTCSPVLTEAAGG